MNRGARGRCIVAVMGILATGAMVAMYAYTAEKLLPPSDARAKKTVDLLARGFRVEASGTVEGDVFKLRYVPQETRRLSDAEAKTDMETMARFVEVNYPEPLSAIQVVREQRVPSGCSYDVVRTEIRIVPQRRPPPK